MWTRLPDGSTASTSGGMDVWDLAAQDQKREEEAARLEAQRIANLRGTQKFDADLAGGADAWLGSGTNRMNSGTNHFADTSATDLWDESNRYETVLPAGTPNHGIQMSIADDPWLGPGNMYGARAPSTVPADLGDPLWTRRRRDDSEMLASSALPAGVAKRKADAAVSQDAQALDLKERALQQEREIAEARLNADKASESFRAKEALKKDVVDKMAKTGNPDTLRALKSQLRELNSDAPARGPAMPGPAGQPKGTVVIAGVQYNMTPQDQELFKNGTPEQKAAIKARTKVP